MQNIRRCIHSSMYLSVIIMMQTHIYPMDSLGAASSRGTECSDELANREQLFIAVQKNDLSTMNKILEKQPSYLNIQDERGFSLLHIAVENDSFLCFVQLCNTPLMNPNIKDNEGNTPLHYAVQKEVSGMVKLLMSRNYQQRKEESILVEYNIKNNINKTPLRIAVERGNLTIIFLLCIGPNPLTAFENNHLHNAAKLGYTDLVEALLRNDEPVNQMDADGHTPLFYATAGRHSDTIALLLANGADLKTAFDRDHISSAVELNCTILVQHLMKAGFEINAFDQAGNTPLHNARDIEIIKALIANRANIQAQNGIGDTPLHGAIQRGDIEIVKELIANGANIRVQNNEGDTPFHVAIRRGNADLVKMFLEENARQREVECRHKTYVGSIKHVFWGADEVYKISNKKKETPLHAAAAQKNYEIVSALLAVQADHCVVDELGSTPLHYAAAQGNKKMVQALLDAGANQNSFNKCGYTPMHEAAVKGYTSVVSMLLDSKVDPNKQFPGHDTALHCAVRHAHFDTTRLLLLKGADVIKTGCAGMTPLVTAIFRTNNADLVKLLVDEVRADMVDQWAPLHLAAMKSHKRVVQVLLESKKFNLNERDADGKVPLYCAVLGGMRENIELLCEHGADPRVIDSDDNTLLHKAAELDYADVALGLIKRGININKQNTHGVTALHDAAYNGGSATVQALISEKEIDVNLQTCEGKTALYLAAERGHDELVVLLSPTANPNIADTYGMTPLHQAIARCHDVTIEKLVNCGADPKLVCAGGLTPLHLLAAYKRSSKLLQLFLDKGADPQVVDVCGRTPLHIVAYDCLDVLNVGLDCLKGKKTDYEHLTLEKADDMGAVGAASNDHKFFITALVDAGAQINAVDKNEDTPLHIAVRLNNVDVAAIFLEHGADKMKKNKAGESPLILSATSLAMSSTLSREWVTKDG